VIAAATGARSVIEIGTGAGVSGLWLLHGAPDAVLTTIDKEPEHLAAAREAFAAARVPMARVRAIRGRAADVLPRMNEKAYDVVLIDADQDQIIDYVAHGLRLVRPGGTVLVPRVLAGGRVADPVARDSHTSDLRNLISETLGSPSVFASLHTAEEGLLQITLPRA
jgi:predicted O-methyltransferase YrrM